MDYVQRRTNFFSLLLAAKCSGSTSNLRQAREFAEEALDLFVMFQRDDHEDIKDYGGTPRRHTRQTRR